MKSYNPPAGSGEFRRLDSYLFDWSDATSRGLCAQGLLKARAYPLETLLEAHAELHKLQRAQDSELLLQTIRETLPGLPPVKAAESILEVLSKRKDLQPNLALTLKHLPAEKLGMEFCDYFIDERRTGRELASQVLLMMGTKQIVQRLRKDYPRLREPFKTETLDIMVQTDAFGTMDILQKMLDSGDTHEKIGAIQLLSRNRSVVSLKILAAALGDASPAIRMQAIEALGKMGKPEGMAALRKVLRDPHETVREKTLEVLGYSDSPAGRELLLEFLLDPRRDLAQKALKILGASGSKGVVSLLLTQFQSGGPLAETAGQTLLGLIKSKKVNGVEVLLLLLQDPEIKEDALAPFFELLRGAGTEGEVVAALKKRDIRSRDTLVRIIFQFRSPEFAGPLADLLHEKDQSLRILGAELLGKLRAVESVPALVPLLQDENWLVKEAAITALGKMNDPRAVRPLIVLFNKEPEYRYVLAKALGALRAKEALPTLLKSLPYEDSVVKHVILDTIEECGGMPPQFAKSFAGLLEDPDLSIRDRARKILANLQGTDEGKEILRASGEQDPLERWLAEVIDRGGTELLLQGGSVPFMRLKGELVSLGENPLTAEEVEQLWFLHNAPEVSDRLDKERRIEVPYDVPGMGRFRLIASRHATGLLVHFKRLPQEIPTLESLKAPEALKSLSERTSGLVLIAGPGNSGKDETLSALINYISQERKETIISLERKIAVVHERHRSVVIQREIGLHSGSFQEALRAALRQDPTVIAAGAVEDRDTAQMIMGAAESGHLVFATLPTTNATATLERFMAFFPLGNREAAQHALADALQGISCQQCVPLKKGLGTRTVYEVLLNTPAIANLLRQGKLNQISSQIATGAAQGMISMDDSLRRLLDEGAISGTQAFRYAQQKKDFEGLVTSRDWGGVLRGEKEE